MKHVALIPIQKFDFYIKSDCMNHTGDYVALTVETKALNDKMQKMMEQLVLANNNRFGRKTEKMHSVTSLTIRYLRKFLLKTVLECW